MNIKESLDQLHTDIKLDAIQLRALLDEGQIEQAQKLASDMLPKVEQMYQLFQEMRHS